MSVAAVITAQHDLRFLASTVGAVLAQRMLPGMIVIADCTGQIEQPMQMTFDVIHSSQDVLTEVPEAKTVRVNSGGSEAGGVLHGRCNACDGSDRH